MSGVSGGSGRRDRSDSVEAAEVVQELCHLLGLKLVGSLTGVKDPVQVSQWAGGGPEPAPPVLQRLRFAHHVLSAIKEGQGKSVAQAWATSVNPRLGYDSPLKAIREDRFQETAAAADALLGDAYDG